MRRWEHEIVSVEQAEDETSLSARKRVLHAMGICGYQLAQEVSMPYIGGSDAYPRRVPGEMIFKREA